jgi:ElaB/YqjD/DUF883 family membrane-anchored ribosome-binding protein
MRASNTISTISDKLRDTASDAGEHLTAAGAAVNQGVHDAAEVAADGVRQSARKAEAAIQDATASGKELYRDAADRAGRSLAGIDTLVARNPVGALVAALGIGLVLGLMARK